ncbi:dynein regulatory complex subunit 6-like isoform X1 [Octopus sinensis]|uniref:Dynein regulatory complex subunit 6-like isoform X1 n=1 Tax=Octopus sinensis TaxID=2607531 RepID=A0A6P7TB67_9MOLL|nr:dynein regulatory complex subunit 6-like isoform X1 [Octopus sinensis]
MAVVPLRNVPAELKQYLVHHRIPDICEALMTALAMICPEDPYLFIINKLLHIKEQGLQSVHWDMFLDETIKSRRALYKCRFEFSFEDDEDENV